MHAHNLWLASYTRTSQPLVISTTQKHELTCSTRADRLLHRKSQNKPCSIDVWLYMNVVLQGERQDWFRVLSYLFAKRTCTVTRRNSTLQPGRTYVYRSLVPCFTHLLTGRLVCKVVLWPLINWSLLLVHASLRLSKLIKRVLLGIWQLAGFSIARFLQTSRQYVPNEKTWVRHWSYGAQLHHIQGLREVDQWNSVPMLMKLFILFLIYACRIIKIFLLDTSWYLVITIWSVV